MAFLTSAMDRKLYLFLVLGIFLVGSLVYFGVFYGKKTEKPSDSNGGGQSSIIGEPQESEGDEGKSTESVVVSKPHKPQPSPKITGEKGRVVFGITDAAAELQYIKSVIVSVSQIQIYSPTKGWVDIPVGLKVYDLLDLRQKALVSLIADASVEVGDYTRTRLKVDSVAVVLNDGKNLGAKLPSGEIVLANALSVKKGESSAIVFDFLVDKSLYTTIDGKYIFMPVLKLITYPGGIISVGSDGKVNISSGVSAFQVSAGMDENGRLKDSYNFDPLARLEILGPSIKVVPFNLNEDGLKISAQGAIDIIVSSGKITNALSVKLILRDNSRFWRVTGYKGAQFLSFDVDGITGAIAD